MSPFTRTGLRISLLLVPMGLVAACAEGIGADDEPVPDGPTWQCHFLRSTPDSSCLCQWDPPGTNWIDATDKCEPGPGRSVCCIGVTGSTCECFMTEDCVIGVNNLQQVSRCHDQVLPVPES
jgi:hypothetical protein